MGIYLTIGVFYFKTHSNYKLRKRLIVIQNTIVDCLIYQKRINIQKNYETNNILTPFLKKEFST